MRIFAISHWVRPAAALALLGALALAGCGDLFSSDDAAGRKNWAVIVGISNYQASQLNLRWAEEDALDMYDTLRLSKGWETDKITLLTNGSATKEGIKAALSGLIKRVNTDDQVVFYYSGRGSYGPDQPPYDEGDGLDEYLVPFEGQPNALSRDLCDDELEALFAALPTNNVVVILDTGFSAVGSRPGFPLDREKSLLRSGSGKSVSPRSVDGMGRELARPGYLYMTASQSGVSPGESNQLRNGVFTYYFTEGLRGAANPSKKTVTAQQGFEYAAPRTAVYEPGQSPQLVDRRGKKLGLTAH